MVEPANGKGCNPSSIRSPASSPPPGSPTVGVPPRGLDEGDLAGADSQGEAVGKLHPGIVRGHLVQARPCRFEELLLALRELLPEGDPERLTAEPTKETQAVRRQERREIGTVGGEALDAAPPDLLSKLGTKVAKIAGRATAGREPRRRVGLPPAVVVLPNRPQQELAPRVVDQLRQAHETQDVGRQPGVIRLGDEAAAAGGPGHDHSG